MAVMLRSQRPCAAALVFETSEEDEACEEVTRFERELD